MCASLEADVKFKMVHLLENVFHFSRVFGNAGKDKFIHQEFQKAIAKTI